MILVRFCAIPKKSNTSATFFLLCSSKEKLLSECPHTNFVASRTGNQPVPRSLLRMEAQSFPSMGNSIL